MKTAIKWKKTLLQPENGNHRLCYCFLRGPNNVRGWSCSPVNWANYVIIYQILFIFLFFCLLFLYLKVTSATKRWFLKMCHMRLRLRIFLFRRKVMFHSQDIQVFLFFTIPWFTKSVTSWWVLVHDIGCTFEYIFWITTY